MCDIRIAAEGARFMLPEVGHGVIPDTGGMGVLYEMCGHGLVSDMVLTGRRLCAEEALAHGIVSRIVPPDELDATAREMAEKIAASPAVTVKLARRVIAHLARPRDPVVDGGRADLPDVPQQVRRLRRVPGRPDRGTTRPTTRGADHGREDRTPGAARRRRLGPAAGTYDGVSVFVTGGGTGLGKAHRRRVRPARRLDRDRQPQARAPRGRARRRWRRWARRC